MAAAEPLLLSTNESDFVLSALAEGMRADGRFLLERRRVRWPCGLAASARRTALPHCATSCAPTGTDEPHGCQLNSECRAAPPACLPLQVLIEFQRFDGKVTAEVRLGDTR